MGTVTACSCGLFLRVAFVMIEAGAVGAFYKFEHVYLRGQIRPRVAREALYLK